MPCSFFQEKDKLFEGSIGLKFPLLEAQGVLL